MKTIQSAQNTLIKQLLELKTPRGRQTYRRFLVAGFHLLEMALESKSLKMILTLEPIKNIPDHIQQIIVTETILKKLSDQVTPQGVVGVCDYLPALSIKGDRIAYLDGVADPGNLGTIIRSATAFGIDMLLVSQDSVSIYNPKTIAASQGAIFTLPLCEATISDLRYLKDNKYRLTGALLTEDAIKSTEYRWAKQCVIVFGNEAHGISHDVSELLNDKIIIPIANIESLNVAMAASIIFYDMKYR